MQEPGGRIGPARRRTPARVAIDPDEPPLARDAAEVLARVRRVAVPRASRHTLGARDVHHLVVEGDTAVALQRLSAKTVKGEDYVNEYAWVYRCVDGKISRLDEYADSLYAAKLFGLV